MIANNARQFLGTWAKALCVVVAIAHSSNAQEIVTNPQREVWFPANEPAHILSIYNRGVATADQVRQAVGDYSFTVTECHNSSEPWARRRSVSVLVAKNGFEDPAVFESLLLDAANFAWTNCPQNAIQFDNTETGFVLWGISKVDIHYHDSLVLSAGELCCDDGPRSSRGYYKWRRVRDFAASDRANVARNVALEARSAEQQRSFAESGRRSYRNGWILFLVFVGVCLYLSRTALLRLWYSLTPHPAQEIIQEALRTGAPIDGHRLAEALQIAPENAVEREVRAGQARAITEISLRHAAQLRAEALKGQAEAFRKLQVTAEQIAFLDAQCGLGEAAIEQDVARVRAARMAGGTSDDQ